ncbi:type II toxin-antitoxin system VapB family antitoxin [Serinicoccus kebangsaanensis]|uniref:type II toxin-antitoxin system VapB family antitoxin n=1 Tax=Serinicoccus kebangsaanensis TaxID=2602069 RepID=UPI00124DED16|nr:type II toxin-antitoxin system VapB family antitoxin [Serinicoccus kebangsaanensis]
MGLNIKNERVHRLAREAARLTGQSQTSVIEEALTRLLASYGVDPRSAATARKVDQAHLILAEYSADPGTREPAIRAPEELYDDVTGLSR